MPRLRVIILEKDHTDGEGNTFNYLMWADVPAARQVRYAETGKVSAWKDATTADNTALQNGSVTEQAAQLRVPAGSTTPQMQAFLQAQWQAFQDQINAFNPWQRYGSTWDGAWNMVNNG